MADTDEKQKKVVIAHCVNETELEMSNYIGFNLELWIKEALRYKKPKDGRIMVYIEYLTDEENENNS